MIEGTLEQKFVESTTGLRQTPCVRFEGGLELETEVAFRTAGENIIERNGRKSYILPMRHGKFREEDTDVIKIHFLPNIGDNERVNDPEVLTEEERLMSAKLCLEDMKNLIFSLRDDQIPVNNTNPDYYIYALTSPRFAAFLKTRCNFRGNTPTEDVWIKKSELISDETLELVEKNIKWFTERLNNSNLLT